MCGLISLAIQLPLASYFLNFELLVLLNTLSYKVLLYLENSAGNYVFSDYLLPDMVLAHFWMYDHFSDFTPNSMITWVACHFSAGVHASRGQLLFRPPVCSKVCALLTDFLSITSEICSFPSQTDVFLLPSVGSESELGYSSVRLNAIY